MKMENFFAFKFITKNKKNKDVNESSMIVVSLIALAIIFFIIALSIMNGYIYNILRISLEVKTFHIDYPALSLFEKPEDLLKKVRNIKEVKYADFYREAKVLLSANGINTGLVYFRTMPEDVFLKDSGFSSCIKMTEGEKSLGKNEIMLSKKTADKLKVKTGSIVHLSGSIKDNNEPVIILKRLKVSGLFTTGYMELDEQIAFIGNSTGDDIFKNDLRKNIFIKLYNYKNAKKVIKFFEVSGLQTAFTWEELNYNEIQALGFERNIIAFIVILVLLMATFNIITTLYIIIHEKKETIGILKAVGFSSVNMQKIFSLNGIYLGMISIFLGVALGLFISNNLNEILIAFSEIINFFRFSIYKIASLFIELDAPEKLEIFSKDFYLDKLYTEISFTEIIIISFTAMTFSIISSVIPAKKAGKIKPYEVLKNE